MTLGIRQDTMLLDVFHSYLPQLVWNTILLQGGTQDTSRYKRNTLGIRAMSGYAQDTHRIRTGYISHIRILLTSCCARAYLIQSPIMRHRKMPHNVCYAMIVSLIFPCHATLAYPLLIAFIVGGWFSGSMRCILSAYPVYLACISSVFHNDAGIHTEYMNIHVFDARQLHDRDTLGIHQNTLGYAYPIKYT